MIALVSLAPAGLVLMGLTERPIEGWPDRSCAQNRQEPDEQSDVPPTQYRTGPGEKGAGIAAGSPWVDGGYLSRCQYAAGTHLRVLIMGRCISLAYACLFGFATCLASVDAAEDEPREVTLQLLWSHQFQFAGFYAAKSQGFYKDEGLRVQIRHGGYDASGKAVNPVEEVVFGRADFGISRSDLLLEHMLGLPVVALAVIYQRSPFVLVTTTGSGLRRLEDIGDKPVMLSLPAGPHTPRVDAATLAMLKRAGIDYRSLNNTRPSWDYRDLIRGKTVLMPGYLTDTPLHVKRAGAEPVIIYPRDYGIDFYGDVLFTSEHMLFSDPDVVSRFRRASLKGWRFALERPQEVTNLILNTYYPDAGKELRELLSYEAQRTIELVQPDLIDVGYMSRERWRRIGNTFLELGLVSGTMDLDRFLYDPGEAHLWQRYRVWILGAGASAVLLLVVLVTAILVNRRLRQHISRREQLEQELRDSNQKLAQLSDTDDLTDLGNRRCLERFLEQQMIESQRYGDPLAIALVDIDHFKQVNDTFGHACGDKVLVAVAQQIRASIREADMAGRYGGEEFLVVFPRSDLDEVVQVMERLQQKIGSVVVESVPGPITISGGIAAYNSGETLARFVSRADQLLYRAKQDGRNRFVRNP
jgi:diguanylate cyclase (GGDEF)-like protein